MAIISFSDLVFTSRLSFWGPVYLVFAIGLFSNLLFSMVDEA